MLIGLYPVAYAFMPNSANLLSTKPDAVLQNPLWQLAFYGHISFGGLALLVGWSQFSARLRQQRMALHRFLGKIYIVAAILSGLGSAYAAFYATGGIIPTLGFLALAVVWLLSTTLAYAAVRSGNIVRHQRLMTYSYAACFAAVTLRIWLPLLIVGFGDFIVAYQVVAWLSWVPNLLVAALLNNVASSRVQGA